MNAGEIAGMIDHTILRADAREEDVIRLCEEAKQYGFASVCVAPYYLKTVVDRLGKESSVRSCVVIGFPMGYDLTRIKLSALEEALQIGAEEMDVVINVGAIKNGHWHYVEEEISAMTALVHQKGRVIKVIFETCYLTDPEIIRLSKLCALYGVDYVKTSTGFGTAGANVRHVQLMRESVNGGCLVKASGGIRSLQDCMAMIEAGADRIGASAGVSIVNELIEKT